MASYEQTASGRVRVSVCKAGVRDSETFDTKPEAKRWAAVREGEIAKGLKVAKAKRGSQTVREAIEKFREEETPRRDEIPERRRCTWLLANLPFLDEKIVTVPGDVIQDWADGRELVVTGSTVNRDLNFLSAIFETAHRKWKWTDHNAIHDVERPMENESRRRRVPLKEVETMLEALGYVRGTVPVSERERLAVAFLVALESGMRKGEMLKTRRSNLHEHHIYLPAAITKSRKARDVALSPAAKELVKLLPADAELLFGGLNATRADVLWRAARAKTKLLDLHFHDSRHEAVTMLAKKMPLLALAEQIGHSDLNSLKIYYNATPQEKAAMLAA